MLAHSAAFARAAGLNMHIIRVLDPKLDVVLSGESSDEVIASVSAGWKEQLFDQLSELGVAGDVSVPVMGSRESLHHAIHRTAGEIRARAIGMGSHGAGLLRHTVMGSVAMGVIGSADVPVLVVGPHGSDAPAPSETYRLMITEDGSQDSRAVVDAVEPLLRTAQMDTILFHLYEPRLGDEGEGEEIDRALRGLETEREGLPDPSRVTSIVRTLPDYERVDVGILRNATELGAQAIAMATHGYSARKHLVAGSTAVGVLKQAEIPVLLVRRP